MMIEFNKFPKLDIELKEFMDRDDIGILSPKEYAEFINDEFLTRKHPGVRLMINEPGPGAKLIFDDEESLSMFRLRWS